MAGLPFYINNRKLILWNWVGELIDRILYLIK